MPTDDAYSWLKIFWIILGILSFLGVVVWAFNPKRRRHLEEKGAMPLDDDVDSPTETHHGR